MPICRPAALLTRVASRATDGQARIRTSPARRRVCRSASTSVKGALPADLRVELIDPGTSPADSRLQPSAISTASAAAALPAIVTRAQWGADESLRSGSPTYDSTVKMAFIHHTASSNSYTKAQAAAAVRSIYAYDTKGLGWSDIAYNVLVDKYGQVFEGRAGGIERAVRSAATGGFNPQTFSVSALGTYVTVAPTSAMVSSIERVLAWKLGLFHLDPFGHARLVASSADGTTSRYANGTPHTFSVISGHRDAGLTQCPGNLLYAKIPAIRTAVKKLIGAAVLTPTTSSFIMDKGSTTPVTINAKAMTAQHWRLEVANSAGKVVRTLNGSAAAAGAIKASWNGNAASGNRVSAGVYTLTLSSWSSSSTAVPYLVNVAVDPDPDVYQPAVNGVVLKLKGLGYGHGHGMSQFGAAGAAVKGLTAAQIVAFYFPGTKLDSVPTTTRIRVRLLAGTHVVSGAPDVRVKPSTGLYVSDGTRVLKLPAKIGKATVSAWRARLNSKGHLDLYGVHGSTSTAVKGWTGLSTVLRFTSTPGAAITTSPGAPTTSRITLITSSGGTRTYRGTIEASPDSRGSSLAAVSDVRLDDYVKAVVSGELPGGWKDAAYQAQAIAARSYALYKQQHASSSARWDLVDSTADQVYLGFSGETSPESKAGTTTAGQYLTYQGKAAFAQYSSSDGGWTSAGGQPYLPAKADPYDGVLTGASNWGHAWTAAISASSIHRAWPSVGTLKSVTAVSRDGHGSWGGRPTSVQIVGSSGQVTVTGSSFRSGLGLRSDWWSVNSTPVQPTWPPSVPVTTVPSVPTVSSVPHLVRVAAHDRSAVVSWKTPVDDGNSPITGYRVTLSPVARTYNVAAKTRSITLPALVNGTTYTVRVAALNGVGTSPTYVLKVTPKSAWSTYVPLGATSLGTWALRPGVARTVPVLGVAGIPSSLVGSVTLRVTANRAATSTTVTVAPAGVKGVPPTLDLGHGTTVVTTSVLTPGSGGAVTLRSPHTVTAEVTVLGYTTRVGAVGNRLVMTDPTVIQGGTSTEAQPVVLSVAGAGVPANASGVVLGLSGRAPVATTLRLPSVVGGPAVTRMVLPSGHRRSSTVLAPLAADGTVSVSSGRAASVSAVVLGYLVADDGRQAVGRFQSLAAPHPGVDHQRKERSGQWHRPASPTLGTRRSSDDRCTCAAPPGRRHRPDAGPAGWLSAATGTRSRTRSTTSLRIGLAAWWSYVRGHVPGSTSSCTVAAPGPQSRFLVGGPASRFVPSRVR